MISCDKAVNVLKNWNLENESVSAIGPGSNGRESSRAFYVGTDYVLKVSENADEIKNAVSLYSKAKDNGVRIPSVVETTSGNAYVQDGGLFFCLTRRVPGTEMTARDFYDGDYTAKSRFVGEIIGRLHIALSQVETPLNDADLYESVKSWALPKAKEILSLPESFSRSYLDVLEDVYAKLPRQIIHRDPNPSNIILSQDEWAFIDLELTEKNVRIYDPCYAALAILSESFDGKDEEKAYRWLEIYHNIISGYDSVAALTHEERAALPYIVMANQFISTAWFSEQDKRGDALKINKNMTLWLLSHFDNLRCPDR